jgi:NSS family neurotransmitter:Na+ symporter
MKREQWKSQFGFLLAAVGSAIGLGNVWRFSYMAYENGGGAYLIPYIVALVTAGVALLILEFGVGHERIGSAPLAYAKINPKWEWLGWWSVIFVMFGINLYYTVIISWCVNFFVLSFDLGWGSNPDHFFYTIFLQRTNAPSEIGHIITPIFVGVIVVWLLNWVIVYRGVQKGVELANKIFMPVLFALTAFLVFWSVFFLEGSMEGIKAYLTPDFSILSSPKVWIAAYGQIFFTLSLGFGIMIAYASYLPKKSDLTKNAFLTAFINSGFSIFAGFAVFSVLGFMATSQGKPIGEVVTAGFGLMFVAYPEAISTMPGGNLFGVIFFLSLVIAGISSSISIIEAFSAAAIDKFGIEKKKFVTILCVLGLLGSIIFTTQGGFHWLDIVDHYLNYALVIVGIAECILVGWIFKLEVLRRHINKVSSIKLGLWWDYIIKFFIPIVLSIILIGNLYTELKEPYGGYSWASLILIGRDWLLLSLIVAAAVAIRPWKTDLPNQGGDSKPIQTPTETGQRD